MWMGMSMAARPPLSRRWRYTLALLGAMFVAGIAGASPALANAGKVLVFTGTAGTANPVSSTAATAIQSLGAANDFTVDVTADATQINAANLAGYRAVAFVNSAGDALSAAQEADLQAYVQGGGGFVGIGETVTLEQGNSFFDTLIGLTGNPRVTGAAASSAQDVEFLDRVHPASRNDPALAKGMTESWYQWANNPTGTVQTLARVRFNTIPDGTSVTNDATPQRWTSSISTNQPQGERAAAWCRDVQQGRSFYSEFGSTTASWSDDNVKKHMLGGIEWAAGMVRGNCKAAITSNYSNVRITPANPSNTSNQYNGELTNTAIADNGLVFYTGRAICSASMTQIGNWDSANTGLGCGTVHVWDPNAGGSSYDRDPAKVSLVANMSVFGAKGSNIEAGQASTSEEGLLAIALDPKFSQGRPYVYIQYFPYYGGEQGKDTTPALGTGFDRRRYRGERRLSRFTYDSASRTFVPGSEKVIMSWTQSVYSCCHEGASAAFDSKGNLYISNGDNIGNFANSNTGGYANPDPSMTAPCPGAAATTHCAQTPADQRPADTIISSYGDARGTSSNTNIYDGKIIRIHPLDNPGDTPGVGSTYTIPDASAPNGANLFPPDSQAVQDGKAKPEIFAMGVRNAYTLHIDKKTDALTTAWVGPDQGTVSPIWGTAKTENATMMNSAGNWGWPYCQGGNRWDYRAKLPSSVYQGNDPGTATAAPFGHPGTVGGGADGQTGGFWDCSKDLLNDSPYNTGLTTLPKPKAVNLWYSPLGGCYNFPLNGNGVPIFPTSNAAASPAVWRSCPWLGTQTNAGQAPMDGGIYRKPAGDKPNAWPSYWDGRWFLGDFAGPVNVRHALLMDPDTQFNGGQPIAADSLLGIVPSLLIGGTRLISMNFGPDGALYVASYSGGYYSFNNNNMGIWRFAYNGGPDTPGPDGSASVSGARATFSLGKSGGVSYKWDFGDGTSSTENNPTHSYSSAGTKTAKLTVTYADGQTSSQDVPVTLDATAFDSKTVDVGVTVPSSLSLTIGAKPTFGALTPSFTKDYSAQTTATVIATTGDAKLAVSDASTTAPGHLANGTFTLASALQAKATSSTNGVGGAFADVGSTASPTTLLTYPGPTQADAVTLAFQQHVAATDPLRAGSYSKTLTFTLSTTTP
jgi:glucose/arabinose dehydrogenase/type 1 glutamine amidotransferase